MSRKRTVREVVISALEICVLLVMIGYVGVAEIILGVCGNNIRGVRK
ncbi:hypothetical protein ES705_40822 [subsurface metagenome]